MHQDIFEEIKNIYESALSGAEQVITEHQIRIARKTLAQVFVYIAPPPDISTAEWADKYRYLAQGTTQKPGRWKTSERPFLLGIMNAFDNPLIDMVTIKKASRMGMTEIINNKMGKHIHLDPCAIMYVQQTLGEAKKYNSKIFKKFIEATPVLRGILPDDYGSRRSGNTVLEKTIPGGSITLVGANVATGFRMVFIKLMILDDVDGFPWIVGKEGDPVKNAIGRTTDQSDRKIILASKPTIPKFSRIDQSYETSNKQLYNMPCPHCDHGQPFRFSMNEKDIPYGLKWNSGDPYSAYYLCEQCGGVIKDHHKKDMLEHGDWIATAIPVNPQHAGFGGLSHLYHPDMFFYQIAQDFVDCGDNPEHKQVFFNDRGGECWEDQGAAVSENVLFARREDWTPGILPEGICILTGDADVGDNHIAASIEGWGRGMENWVLDYTLFEGDTLLPEIWDNLRKYVLTIFKHYCGIDMRSKIFGIDIRYRGEMVAEFIRSMRKAGVKVIAHQGVEKTKSGEIMSGTVPSKKNKQKIPTYTINDDKSKLSVLGRLKISSPKPGEISAPGYVHFPTAEWANPDYFEQLLSEKKIKTMERGRPVWKWIQKPGVRNEPLDVKKGNLAMLIWLQKHEKFDLDKTAQFMAERVEIEKAKRIERGELQASEYFMERARQTMERARVQEKKKPNKLGLTVLSRGIKRREN